HAVIGAANIDERAHAGRENPVNRQPITRSRSLHRAPALAACLLATLVASAHAETSRTCTGFIDSVPAVVSTQGVWCLRGDLSTAQASGSAVEIAANNVTIDCNGFKIGGLAAGDASTAAGIHADGYRNAVVRNCSIRGFHHGIHLTGGSGTLLDSTGHLVEDNRIDNSLRTGIRIHPSRGSLVRRNRVFDTGGAPGEVYAAGIYAQADVVDNLVAGLFATGANGYPRAINVYGGGNVVSGNIAYGLVPSGPMGSAQG